MKIYIKQLFGGLIGLEVEADTTIRSIVLNAFQQRASAQQSATLDNYVRSIHLRGGEKILALDKKLLDYDIKENATFDEIASDEAPFLEPLIPTELICPLSMQLFLDPVKLPDGVSVERECIEKWLRLNRTNPFNRQTLCRTELITDDVTKANVMKFLEAHKFCGYYNSLCEKQYKLDDAHQMMHETASGPIAPDADDLVAMFMPEPGVDHLSILPPPNYGFTLFQLSEFLAHSPDLEQYRRGRRSAKFIQETVERLQTYGLTSEMVDRYWQPSVVSEAFSKPQKDALIYFVTGQPSVISHVVIPPLSPVEALQEITQLNKNALESLMLFYSQGLRGDHLRSWDGVFSVEYKFALMCLVRDENLAPVVALERICDLSSQECWTIEAQSQVSMRRR